jgi:hypothetical protein
MMQLALNTDLQAQPRPLPFGMVLAMVTLLPTLVFYLGISSSLTLGSMFAALIIQMVAVLYAPPGLPGHLLAPQAFTLLLTVVVLLHLLGAGLANPIDAGRAAASLLPLALILSGGAAFGRLLAMTTGASVHRAAWGYFLLLCALPTLPLLGIEPSTFLLPGTYAKPVFPFTEPSHLALIFIPLLMYCCISSVGKARWSALLLGAMVAGLLQNLTLVVGWTLVFLICVRGFALPFMATILALLVAQLDLSYYVERLDFSGNVINLSNAVYLQGWQLIDESLTNSNLWGLGFQQLGVQGTEVPASQLIYTLTDGNYANLLDGGFTLAKVISELGVLGGILVALYLVRAGRSILALRSSASGATALSPAVLFSHSMIVAYLIELFIRGVGYFTGTAILLVGSLWLVTGRGTARTKLPRIAQ